MAKIRGVRFAANATGAYNHTVANALRDILPDQRFKIHHIMSELRIDANSDVEIQFMKNIPDPPGPLADAAPVTQHGLFLQHYAFHLGSHYFSDDFAEPIDFDKDDSLNIRFYVSGAVAATLETCILYSVGK